MENMPKKGTYTFLLVLGFLMGLIWGLLSLGPYKAMNAAVEAGNADEAWANAKKIKRFIIIGVVINVLILIGKMAQVS